MFRTGSSAGAENRELRQANEIAAQGVGLFCPGGLDRRYKPWIAFIDDHREVHGSSRSARSCRRSLDLHAHVAKRTDPKKLSTRAKQDLTLTPEIARVFARTSRSMA